MQKKYCHIIIVATLFLILSGNICQVSASEVSQKYKRALKEASAGRYEFALMYHRDIIRQHQHSKYAPLSLFAQGEFYFNQGQYKEAKESFEQCLNRNDESNQQLFALAFLYKITLINKNKTLRKNLKKNIVTHKQISLVFKENMTYKYVTPLNQHLKAIIKIDQIEFYKNEKLFLQIAY